MRFEELNNSVYFAVDEGYTYESDGLMNYLPRWEGAKYDWFPAYKGKRILNIQHEYGKTVITIVVLAIVKETNEFGEPVSIDRRIDYIDVPIGEPFTVEIKEASPHTVAVV